MFAASKLVAFFDFSLKIPIPWHFQHAITVKRIKNTLEMIRHNHGARKIKIIINLY